MMRTLVVLTIGVLPLIAPAAQRPGPFVFMYGAQEEQSIPKLAAMGMNAICVTPELADAIELRQLDRRVELAGRCGMGSIIVIPTVTSSFDLMPTPTGGRYREWAVDLITRIVGHFRDSPDVVAWATGDFLEESIDYNSADFRAFIQRRHRTVEALNEAWGTKYTNWGDLSQQAARDLDQDMPFGVGRASVDVADYRLEACREVMSLWAATIKGLDPSRPLMTGRISRYRGLAAVPQGYDIVCPFMSPLMLEDDPLTHNVHAVDMARRAGRFEVIPCLAAPLTEQAYGRGDLARWVGLAALHGARGVGIADWQTIQDSAAPTMVFRELGKALTTRVGPETFTIQPTPTIALLYEPYAGGFDAANAGVYGYLEGFSAGEPNNPFHDLRLGSRYGITDYITLDDLPLSDLSQYGVLLAPMALRMPRNCQAQLVQFVRSGGALVCDLGLGMYETGSWLRIPETFLGAFGMSQLIEMEQASGILRVGWPPEWLASMPHGAKTQGARRARSSGEGSATAVTGAGRTAERRREFTGAASELKALHVNGPAAYASLDSGGSAIAVLGTKYKGERLIAGIIGSRFGAGVACFATHQLWANWTSSDPVYATFHHDLFARRSSLEMFDVSFWTEAVCATTTRDGVAVFNGRQSAQVTEVVAYDAGHALYTGAVCRFSALARNVDGMRSGACQLSVSGPPMSLTACRRLAVLVQPYTDTCTARVITNAQDRLSLALGGDGAKIGWDGGGKMTVSRGVPTEVRLTVGDGVYRVAPGSRHKVRIKPLDGSAVEAQLTATSAGQLRFSHVFERAVVTLKPADR